uniref:Uncharacterized protein n=1 Tax=Aureoumbra lagunensis TaxID=44058 RepID=A0A7S3K513_9STRA|mmetsp:Transcript_13310/g.17777  ORF Transcript_13310/g.17777 Transcript_13310/m.17777 type:complete len:456 (-) Transcript_13310:651-2018(-)
MVTELFISLNDERSEAPMIVACRGKSSNEKSSNGRSRIGSKRKAHDDTSSMSGDSKNVESKKRRFVWPADLHSAFVSAVFDIGLQNASSLISMEAIKNPQISSATVEWLLATYKLQRKMKSDLSPSQLEKYSQQGKKATLQSPDPTLDQSKSGVNDISKENPTLVSEEHSTNKTTKFIKLLELGSKIVKRQADLAAQSDDLLRKFQLTLHQSLEAQCDLVSALKGSSFAHRLNDIRFIENSLLLEQNKDYQRLSPDTKIQQAELIPAKQVSTHIKNIQPPLPTSTPNETNLQPTFPRLTSNHNCSRQPTTMVAPPVRIINRPSTMIELARESQSGHQPLNTIAAAPSVIASSGKQQNNISMHAVNTAEPQMIFRAISPPDHTNQMSRKSLQSEMEARMSMHREMLYHKSDQHTVFDDNEEMHEARKSQYANSNQQDSSWNFNYDLDEELFNFLGP